MNDINNTALKLKERMDYHRNIEERGITCRTNCWCWDAEALLLALEAAHNSAAGERCVCKFPGFDANNPAVCPTCHKPIFAAA